MSKPEPKFSQVSLPAELVKEIEDFIVEHEAIHKSVDEFVQEAARLHMQKLGEIYTQTKVDSFVFLQNLLTNR
jgi:metal-responsive CopG/Arc/MetJ family transcriptional regulator